MMKRILEIQLPLGQSAYLWGARKTGKSTYLHAFFPEAWVYDLLETDTFLRFTKNPQEFREEILSKLKYSRGQTQVQQFIIVDEIQKIPLLLNEIHYLIEKVKVQFILCGSSARNLRVQQANFLGGRAWIFNFFPLVYPELQELDLLKIFKQGGLPAHYLYDENSAKESIKAYIEGYILQEIRLETRIRNLNTFMNFLDLVSFCQGDIINFSNIARDCGVSSKTVQSYFELLVDMLLGYFIHPFTKNNKRNLIMHAPKFYLFDVGIANYLAKRNITELQGAEAGQALEHYLCLELYAYLKYNRIESRLLYWKTKTGLEVDFIVQEGKIAIECKISKNIDKREYRGLLAFKDNFPEARLIMVALVTSPRMVKIPTDQGTGMETEIEIMPLEFFLKQLWAGKIIHA